ncbi:hypothetical protein BJX70DRAFT_185577 [Aspergillus crustosus]
MSLLRSSTALFLLSTLSFQAQAQQDLPEIIVGCNDLDCPLDDTYQCHLDDTTYTDVGLARIADTPSSLDGISLLKAVHVADADQINETGPDDTVPYRSAYYLGIPESISTEDISGCAVIFNDNPGQFDGDDAKSSVGDCMEVMEESCADALVSRAAEIGDGNCDAFGRELRGNAIDECRDFAGEGKGLGNFTVVSLGGLNELAGSQNGSSDCWPVTPKTDGLAFFDEEIVFSEFTDAESTNQLFKVTPILTIFPGDDETSSAAQLTCLKAVEVIEDEDSEGGGGGDGDAGALFSANILTLASGLTASVLFAML